MDALERQRAALVMANDVRIRRAAVKRDLRAGRVTMESLFMDTPIWLRGARVFDIVQALPRVGHKTAGWVLNRAGAQANATFASLSDKQRRQVLNEIARCVRERNPGPLE